MFLGKTGQYPEISLHSYKEPAQPAARFHKIQPDLAQNVALDFSVQESSSFNYQERGILIPTRVTKTRVFQRQPAAGALFQQPFFLQHEDSACVHVIITKHSKYIFLQDYCTRGLIAAYACN